MESLYRPLAIPTSLLAGPFNRPKYVKARHQHLDRSDISSKFLDWVDSLDIVLDHAEVFFSIPGNTYMIHQDHHSLIDFPKINWVYGVLDSHMNWFKPKVVGESANTTLSTPFVKYSPTDVELLYSTSIASPSLVQAGIPHNISNVNGFRWCISTVYTYRDKRLIPWNDMIKILSPYLTKIQDQH